MSPPIAFLRQGKAAVMSYYRALEMAGVKKVLDLTSTELTFLPSEVLAVSVLENLILDEKKILSLPNQIGGLQRLRVLSIRKNQLSTIPDSISRLERLERLDLSMNHIVDVPVKLDCTFRAFARWQST